MEDEMRADYPYIRAWGRLMNSRSYYVEDQVNLARKERAPQRAVYRGQDGKWVMFDDVRNSVTRFTVENILDEMGAR